MTRTAPQPEPQRPSPDRRRCAMFEKSEVRCRWRFHETVDARKLGRVIGASGVAWHRLSAELLLGQDMSP